MPIRFRFPVVLLLCLIGLSARAQTPVQAQVLLRSGHYPLYLDAVLIFKAQPQGLARQFLEFIASPAGRAVIEAQGSLPVGKP